MMHHVDRGVSRTLLACLLSLKTSLGRRSCIRRCGESSRSWMLNVPWGTVDAASNTFVLPHVHVSVIDDFMQVCGMNDRTVD